MVDTGAAISCCSINLLKFLGIGRNQLTSSDIKDALGVGGEIHSILGVVNLPLVLGNTAFRQNFHVFEKLQQQMILGMDFLEQNKVDISLASKIIYIPDFESNSVNAVELNSGLARTVADTKIPPFHQADIPISVSNIRSHIALIEPLPALPERSLAGAKCCVSLQKNNQSCLRVMNPTHKSIILPANSVVASVSAISPDNVLPMSSPKVDSAQPQQNVYETQAGDDFLEFDLDNADLTDEQKILLTHFLNKNRKVFAKDLTELGHTHLYKHSIETGNAPPVRKRFYRQSPIVHDEMNRQIEKMLKSDIIEESDSEWQSPVVMCKKKSGELRFCVDYRALNKVTKPKFFPLPRLEDVFDALGRSEATIFSTLDLLSGYWQCGLDPATAHKAAFVTPSGVYQWKRLPFGLASAPSSFQHLLTQVLKHLNYKIALVYVDDILVFSRTFEEHLQHLQQVFDRLIAANLTLKPNKCMFARQEVLI